MEDKYVDEYLKNIASLSDEEKKQHNLYLKRFHSDAKDVEEGQVLYGPPTGVPEIDKPFLKYYSDAVILEDLPKMTIVDYIWKRNENNMDEVFADYFNLKITYNELKQNVDKMKAALIANGIKPYTGENGEERQKVGVALPTMPETFYLILAIIDLGGVATMLDPRINETRIRDCVKAANCDLVFTVDKFNEKFDQVAEELGMQDKFVSISGANSLSKAMQFAYKVSKKIKKTKSMVSFDKFMSKGKGIDASNIHGKYVEDDPAAIEFTSGTTQAPKGVFLSNKNLIGIADQEKNAFPKKERGDIFLDIMPPFIAYGLACGIVATLSEGLRLRLIPTFESDDFGKLILKYKPQHVIGVPSFYEKLTKDKRVQNADLSFLKYCIAGGDKLPVAAEERINKFFAEHGILNRIIKGYGMTELSSVAAVNLDNDSNKLGSTGIPFPKNNVRVVDPETGKRVSTGEIGEIQESGPTQMIGYLDNPELDSKIFTKDEAGTVWVKTGDRGKIDEDGQIFIDGRYKNTIVRPDGHNVYPKAIEDIINAHPAVESCVVVGIRNPEVESGEIPVAFIVFNEGYEDKQAEIIEEINQICLEKLPPRDVALDYKVIKEMPTTSVGKIDINKLKNENETHATLGGPQHKLNVKSLKIFDKVAELKEERETKKVL